MANGFANSNKNFVQMLNPARAGNTALGMLDPRNIGSNTLTNPVGAIGDQLGLSSRQNALLNPIGLIGSQGIGAGQDFVQGNRLNTGQQLGAASVLGVPALFTDQIQNTLGLGSRNTEGNSREDLFNRINDGLSKDGVKLNTRGGDGRINDLRSGGQFSVTKDANGNTTSGVRQQLQQLGLTGDKGAKIRNILSSFADFSGGSDSGGRNQIAETLMLELNGDEAEVKKFLESQGADTDKLIGASLQKFQDKKISGVEFLTSVRAISELLGGSKDEGGELSKIVDTISNDLIPEGGLDRYSDGTLTEGAKKQLALRQVFGDDTIDVFALGNEDPEIEQFLLNISDANGFKNQVDLRRVDDKVLRRGLEAISKASGKNINIEKAIERINSGEIIINENDLTGVNLENATGLDPVMDPNVDVPENEVIDTKASSEKANLLDSITRVTSGNSLTKDKNPLDDIKYSIQVYENKLKSLGIDTKNNPDILTALEAHKRLSEKV